MLAASADFGLAFLRQCRDGNGAGVALPCFEPFFDGESRDKKSGDRVGPCPTEEAVQQQTYEKGRREVAAEQGLPGVGDGRCRPEFAPGAALEPTQEWHDRVAHRREGDVNRAVLGCAETQQRESCVDDHVGGESEE